MDDTKSEEEGRANLFQNIVDLLNYYVVRSEGCLGGCLAIFIKVMEIWACVQFVIDFEWIENFGLEQAIQEWGWTHTLFLVVFAVDYSCRIVGHYGYPSVVSYVFSWMGLIDGVVVLACFGEVVIDFVSSDESTAEDVRAIGNILFSFRLVRMAKLLKIQACTSYMGALNTEMSKVVLSMFTLIFASAAIFTSSLFEDLREEFINPYENIFGNTDRVSWFNSFYFSSTTILAVGYGDIAPKTVTARMMCTAVQLVAYTLMAYNITRLLDAFTEAHRLERENDLELELLEKCSLPNLDLALPEHDEACTLTSDSDTPFPEP